MCAKDFKIGHGGHFDIKEHERSTSHKKNAGAGTGCHQMKISLKIETIR